MYIFRKQAYFVDLFVRVSNKVAVDMYTRLGYSVYRRVLEYYSGDPDEDAFGKISKIYYQMFIYLLIFCFRYAQSFAKR